MELEGPVVTETGAAEDKADGQEKMMVDDKADDEEECDDCLTPPDGVKKLLLEELQSVGAACAASGDWSKMEGESCWDAWCGSDLIGWVGSGGLTANRFIGRAKRLLGLNQSISGFLVDGTTGGFCCHPLL